MAWYAAHIVTYFRRKRSPQPRRFVVWENVVLIRAASDEEAFARAEERGRRDAGDPDESLRINGRPAEMVFAGVRKVVLCQDEDRRPGDGTEVTYTEMQLGSEEMIRKLVAGEPVSATIADRFPGEAPATADDDGSQPLRKRCS